MNVQPNHLVSAQELLPAIFGDKDRPSLRWLRGITKQRLIPHLKVGRLVRYDPVQVRAALDRNCLVKARGVAP